MAARTRASKRSRGSCSTRASGPERSPISPRMTTPAATLEGVTLGLDLAWRETRVVASLDLQDPTDDATGNLLPRRAREHGAIKLLQQAGPVQFGVEFVASSRRFDDAADVRALGGYGIVNLTLEWPFAKGLSLLVRGDNVFNKNYQLAADYSTGGATVFAAIRWQP